MTDLVIFVMIVAVMVVVGILVGMIVAGRIDRIVAPRPVPPASAVTPGPERPDEEQHP